MPSATRCEGCEILNEAAVNQPSTRNTCLTMALNTMLPMTKTQAHIPTYAAFTNWDSDWRNRHYACTWQRSAAGRARL